MKALEAEALAIDELDADAEVGRESLALVVRRRAFLASCRDSGVFAADHGPVREQWLGYLSALRVLALRKAPRS